MANQDSLNYAAAGVDIDAANELVDKIKSIAKKTSRPGVMAGIGGFGSLFEIPASYQQPVLVSGTDGVGTKLKLAIKMQQHATIGIDLVAMCVNDILCLGAEPLYFLDYFATSKLNPDQAKDIISGIGLGCEQANCALIGGETAEMPGMYAEGDYDLAGFCVGVVEKDKIIDGSRISSGDVLIGLASSGPHSNGYSLIRKVVEKAGSSYSESFENGKTLGEVLLTPTKIYVKSVFSLLKEIELHALAHITGGGIVENLPRVLPKGREANVHYSSWQWPAIFQWLQDNGNIETSEMQRTFNLGVGMVLVVAKQDAPKAIELLQANGETAWVMGDIQ